MIVLAPDRDTQVLTLEGEELEEELFIDGDRERLSQVLTNLLSNVLAYSPDGSPVEIAVGTNGTHTIIEVRRPRPGVLTRLTPRRCLTVSTAPSLRVTAILAVLAWVWRL